MIELSTPCEGWFSLSAFKVDEGGKEVPGSRREPVPPFRNLITDAGLNRMGAAGDWLSWCQVGSGSTAPTFADTSLTSRVAGTNSISANSVSAQPSTPYYIARTNTYRFAAGVAQGNLSEVGVGWGTTGLLFSRALVLDALGSPTTITVLSDELLDVTYQFRQYMPEVDYSGSIVLRGVTHAVVSRPALSTTAAGSATVEGWFIGQTGTDGGTIGGVRDLVYNGGIGTITGNPTGLAMAITSNTPSNYSAGSLFRDFVLFLANLAGNDPAGIGAVRLRMGIGMYQFGFTPRIMKTSGDTLSLTFRHSWSRKTL